MPQAAIDLAFWLAYAVGIAVLAARAF